MYVTLFQYLTTAARVAKTPGSAFYYHVLSMHYYAVAAASGGMMPQPVPEPQVSKPVISHTRNNSLAGDAGGTAVARAHISSEYASIRFQVRPS
jgi:hypothetical protein